MVELHKGTISVFSKEGEGSTFSILLPLEDSDYENEKAVLAEPYFFDEIINNSEVSKSKESVKNRVKGNGNKEIILIVEDNKDVRNYICEQLIQEYSVIDAANGEEGILKSEQFMPDLIISDVMMPKKDGYQFSKEIRENEKTSHIPIIMLTAKAALDDKLEGLETGVDAYLTKPFSAKELQVRVKNLIYQRKQLRRRFSKATFIKPSEVSAVSADQQFMEKVVSIIEKHFADENFSAEILASNLHMSISQINRKLNTETILLKLP